MNRVFLRWTMEAQTADRRATGRELRRGDLLQLEN